jgi:LmbE family N-acetylglucosaminyl deacetylase
MIHSLRPHFLAFVTSLLGVTALAAAGATPEPPPRLPDSMSAAEILLSIEKLNVLGRVLYVAAHPDDENTALISYWANGALYDAAYLSITRGDGGQNLIGPELREPLGVIRTNELLAARRLDHGRQFFTRAVDFGFSKNPEESLRFWDHDKMLADVVWVIRRFQPDVIVTRFQPDDRNTHGHHSASAQLAVEAFRAAADPKKFPEQLAYAGVWQAKRVVWNTSSFFYTARNLPFDTTGLTSIEIGGFNPLLGKSYMELAAASRSMHKSQGFGVPVQRGARKDYFKPLDGDAMTNDLFDGVDTTWARVPGGAAIAAKVSEVIGAFRAVDPAASVPGLLQVRQAVAQLPASPWVTEKRNQVDQVIAAALGLHAEAVASKALASPGQNLSVQIEAINPSNVDVKLRSLTFPASAETVAVDAPLAANTLFKKSFTPKLPETLPYSQPYWLRKPGTIGTFDVSDQLLIGLPENPPAFPVNLTLDLGGQEFQFTVDTQHRSVDPVQGEVHQALVIAPPVFANFAHPVFVFGDDKVKSIQVRVIGNAETTKGQLSLEAPAGWRIEPAGVPVELKKAGDEMVGTFNVKPPANPSEGVLRAVVTIDAKRFSFARQRLNYPHIGLQTLMPAAESKLVRADIRRKGDLIGYLPGAGDDIPESLEQIGYTVKTLADADVKAAELAHYSAIVIGVRAFNTQDRMAAWLPELLAYVKKGGVVIAQYNTNGDLKVENIGPFPFRISRDRVTDETAEVRLLAPTNPLVTTPNRITKADFDGWVQERGLYFPDQWDAAWTPIFSSNDPGEKALDGGLLVARYGDGWFVYTGYSWFRQLPAGVPGAYRIFANMISLGK